MIEPKKEGWWAFGVTTVGLGLFYLLDQMYPQVTLAPFAGALVLFALALVHRPLTVGRMFVLISLYVGWSLVAVPGFNWADPESRVRIGIRLATFGMAGVMAVLASFFRVQLASMLEQTETLLAKLPVGILLSDAGGRVVWGNDAAEEILGVSLLKGRLWWEVMPSDGRATPYEVIFAEPSRFGVEGNFPDHVVHLIKLVGTRKPLLTTVIYYKRPRVDSL